MFHIKLLINFLSLSIAGQIDYHAFGKFIGPAGPVLKPSESLGLLQADPFGLLRVHPAWLPRFRVDSSSMSGQQP